MDMWTKTLKNNKNNKKNKKHDAIYQQSSRASGSNDWEFFFK